MRFLLERVRTVFKNTKNDDSSLTNSLREAARARNKLEAVEAYNQFKKSMADKADVGHTMIEVRGYYYQGKWTTISREVCFEVLALARRDGIRSVWCDEFCQLYIEFHWEYV